MIKNNLNKGFTLIELLVVIAIISILSVFVLVSLNPIQRFADANDSHRLTDIDNITKAFRLYTIDNNGLYPNSIDSNFRMLGTDASGCDVTCDWQENTYTTETACINISTNVAKYMKSIPIDPELGSNEKTYYAVRTSNGIIDVISCGSGSGSGSEPSSNLVTTLVIDSDWSTGFCGTLTITNNGATNVSSWEVTMAHNDSTITSSWSGNFLLSSPNYIITNLAWNNIILASGNVTGIGFCSNKTGINYLPTIVQTTE